VNYTEQFELNSIKHEVVLEQSIDFKLRRFGVTKGIIVGAIISSTEEIQDGKRTIYDHDHRVYIRVTREGNQFFVTDIERPDIILDDLDIIKT